MSGTRARGCDLVVVGASWGGLNALRILLGGLPPDFGAPVVVVQHRSAESHPTALRELLDAGCDALRRLGYKPFYFDSILEQDLYFAGPWANGIVVSPNVGTVSAIWNTFRNIHHTGYQTGAADKAAGLALKSPPTHLVCSTSPQSMP